MLLALYLTAACALAVLSLEPPHVTPLWPMVVLAAAGTAVIVLRRQHPRLAFTAALALALVSTALGSGAEGLLAVGAMYLVGRHARSSVAWSALALALIVGAAGAAALALRGILLPPLLGLRAPTDARDVQSDLLNYLLIVLAGLLIAALLGINAGHRRRHIEDLEYRAAQLMRERDQQAQTARSHERERIAREMHDVIAHSLSVMIAISEGAHLIADDRPQEAKTAMGRVAETGRRTLGEVRRLLGTVRGDEAVPPSAPQPDASRLGSLVQEFVGAGLPTRLTVTGRAPIDPALGLTVYRIVQESLTNALRHAAGVTAVDVQVGWAPGEVTVVVQDDGRSVPVAEGRTGRGLLGIQERAALYDGDVDAGPYAQGWRVRAHLIWDESNATEDARA